MVTHLFLIPFIFLVEIIGFGVIFAFITEGIEHGIGVLLALHATVCQLLHHLEELLTVIFEQVVSDGEDSS